MSANNVTAHIACDYQYYTVKVCGKKYIIGGGEAETAKDADAIILLTSMPKYCTDIAEIVKAKPDIEIYATSAGLRNIKEIINCEINEKLIKDKGVVDGLQFIITPGLPWVDTLCVSFGDTLFSGELFSRAPDFKKGYYASGLDINRQFVVSALDRLKAMDISRICPSSGDIVENVEEAFRSYYGLTKTEQSEKKRISLIYSSEYGFSESMAEYLYEELKNKYDVYYTKADSADYAELNKSDILLIGTNTINKNAPKSVWDAITRLDLVNKRGMPYFVFGSFGWAGDGIKLIDKTLNNMGMTRIAKPLEVLFKPDTEDFASLSKIVEKIDGLYK